MITIEGLTKSFGSRRVLDGLDLIARPGAVTLLVGANGSGSDSTASARRWRVPPDSRPVCCPRASSRRHCAVTASIRVAGSARSRA